MSTSDSKNRKDKMSNEDGSTKSSTTKIESQKKTNVAQSPPDTLFLKVVRFLKKQFSK